MSTEANKKLICDYINEIINTGNVEHITNFIAPDYTEIHDGKRYPIGIDGAKEHILGVRKTYPDLKLTIENQIAEGEWVATCITAQGTHEGVWLSSLVLVNDDAIHRLTIAKRRLTGRSRLSAQLSRRSQVQILSSRPLKEIKRLSKKGQPLCFSKGKYGLMSNLFLKEAVSLSVDRFVELLFMGEILLLI